MQVPYIPINVLLFKEKTGLDNAMEFDKQVFKDNPDLKIFIRPYIEGEFPEYQRLFSPEELKVGKDYRFQHILVQEVKSGLRMRRPIGIMGTFDENSYIECDVESPESTLDKMLKRPKRKK